MMMTSSSFPRGPLSDRVSVDPSTQHPDPADERLNVIYIAGWGRSGSTLLDNLLGQIDGFFSTGELRYLWDRGVLGEWRCGCGERVTECAVWSSILAPILPDRGGPDPRTVVVWQHEVARLRHTWKLLRANDQNMRQGSALCSYSRLVGELFSSVAKVTGARVIVDSSKQPSHGAILMLIPHLRVHVVHLVRDPRAVAFSWAKRQPGIDRHGVVNSTLWWTVSNLATDALRRKHPERSLLVRYEDFVRSPSETLKNIVELVNEDPQGIPSIRGREFDLAPTHTVSGNPARFRTGSVEVRPDDEWIERLGTVHKATASLLSFPLLRRYGYPLRSPDN
jgi:hypothetical protein